MARLSAGDRVIGAWSLTGSPMACEALVAPGIDFVGVDLQHGAPELADLRPVVTAIENRGAVALARVAVNDAAVIGRALDLGALGALVPLVDDAAGAAAAVAATRHWPVGVRSYGPTHFAWSRHLGACGCSIRRGGRDDRDAPGPGGGCDRCDPRGHGHPHRALRSGHLPGPFA